MFFQTGGNQTLCVKFVGPFLQDGYLGEAEEVGKDKIGAREMRMIFSHHRSPPVAETKAIRGIF
jgi:hypothetical protein